MCPCVTDSLYCTEEANTILYTNYIPINNYIFKKDKLLNYSSTSLYVLFIWSLKYLQDTP